MNPSQLKIPFAVLVSDEVDGVIVWRTVASAWGTREAIQERLNAQSIERNLSHRVTVRCRSDISFECGMRLYDGEMYYVIRSVRDTKEPERYKYLYVEACVEL